MMKSNMVSGVAQLGAFLGLTNSGAYAQQPMPASFHR
jgi:hypothetical protein